MKHLPMWVLALLLLAAGCSPSTAIADAPVGAGDAKAATFHGSTPALRVLFVGNSYTYGYDMADVVETIAKANGVPVNTDVHAIGSTGLDDHLADPRVRSLLISGDYDVVVLQERSETPALPGAFERDTAPAAIELAELARGAGAQVVFFQTWGHAQGNTFTGHATYGAMQQQVITSYDQLANQLDATVAPVGAAWREAMLLHPHIELHDADQRHQSPAGAYLAALVFADMFVVGPLTESPDGLVDRTTATQLLQVAALVDEN